MSYVVQRGPNHARAIARSRDDELSNGIAAVDIRGRTLHQTMDGQESLTCLELCRGDKKPDILYANTVVFEILDSLLQAATKSVVGLETIPGGSVTVEFNAWQSKDRQRGGTVVF